MWTRTRPVCLFIVSTALAGGCAFQYNPHPTTSETDSLSDIIQVTSNFDRAGEAYFSRDMRWIVFQAVPTGQQQYQMYLASVKTGPDGITGINTPIRISPMNSRNTCGYFSNDGVSLIFSSTAGKEDPNEPAGGYQREGGQYRWTYPAGMEIYRADGWERAIAVAEPGRITNLAQHPLTDNKAYDAECAFSPDGKWIVFTSNRSGDLELWAMHSDGSNPVQLTHTPGYDGGPFFSPDGRRIVYRSDRRGNDLLQIFVADVVYDRQGEITGIHHEHQLTDDKGVNWGPFWSPDGGRIIWASSGWDHSNYDLWLMRADGSLKTRITFDPAADVLPVFSPDGKYLMWASKRNGQSVQIYLAKFKLPAKS